MKRIKSGTSYTIYDIDEVAEYVVNYVFRDENYDNRIVEMVLKATTNGNLALITILSEDGVEYSATLQTSVNGEMFKPYLSETMMRFVLQIIKDIKEDNNEH